ncbi:MULTISPECIES: methyltransferase [unclassified Nitrosospira]|uniref:methyltransferase n=1 Tax=unclassified Nitrosospira TaxID=2609267 RepID=UPI000D2F73AC|nr:MULTISPECIES: methyltransferase [unclassified Nitrosospira]PTR15596.1 O-methyltransferase [Nitrosospira sp. Nsp2]WON75415.1 methyltransferase [Nitrosospira sp. Is2]
MSKVPTEIDEEGLILLSAGHTAFQLLWAGIELDLYDKLSIRPAQTLDELAQSLKLALQPARILLIGLTALGIIRLENERYYNAQLTEERMVKGKPGYAGTILGWQAHIVYPGMMDFVRSLKESRNVGLTRFSGTESNLYGRLTHDKTLEKVFQDAMSGLSRLANQFLPKAMDFSPYKLVVDAGGGDGTNALAIAQHHSMVKTCVFDSASVCEYAKHNIQQAGMTDRVSTHPGNFFHDPFPSGTDCIVYCHILTIWSMDRNRILLKRTFDALPETGAVVIFNMMGGDDDRGPLSTALGSPYFLAIATGEGMLHPWKDYEAALEDAGFQRVVRLDQGLPVNHGILVGFKK